MKKVVGVMILAGLPVACGTTLPSTPEATPAASGQDAARGASASGEAEDIRFVPVPEPTCSRFDANDRVDGVKIVVLEQDKGWVRLGAKVDLNGDPTTLPRQCFVIAWSANRTLQRHVLTPSPDTQEATLLAPRGAKFTILGAISARRGSVVGQTSVVVP